MLDGQSQSTLLQPRFGLGFLDDYAGRLITDPKVAIVELVANCWDAGAKRVDIIWPDQSGGRFEITDNGCGMTKEEFERIWYTFSYNRIKDKGPQVQFPDSDPNYKTNRNAYGRNGKGRHSLFCFSNGYYVETWKNGNMSVFHVKRSNGDIPYTINFESIESKTGHGTMIYCNLKNNYIDEEDVRDLLGTKFATDPAFEIYLNKRKIELFNLKDVDEEEFDIDGEGKVKIITIDSKKTGRTSKQHGVAWWVNKRLVGEHSWKGFEGAYLDGRTSEAKRYTFIVEADMLINEIKADWTGFKDTPRANNIISKVNDRILESIKSLLQDIRQSAKVSVLSEHRSDLRKLNPLSREQIGRFVDEIQMKCPTMTHTDLSNTIGILTKMEMSRTGYDLLQQLVALSPKEMDKLAEILEQWSVSDAKEVLCELQWRLVLIQKIESLMNDPNTDELHDLQPLFERGLWIFGPEYEGVKFFSNTTLAVVLKEKFGGGTLEYPLKRPDFIVFDDNEDNCSSVGVYCSDGFDENGVTNGVDKVLIIELKRGGSTIKDEHCWQAKKYADEIKNCKKVDPLINVKCFVLGTNVECAPIISGLKQEVVITPRPYMAILRQAHNRTFNLMSKIQDLKQIDVGDREVNKVIEQTDIGEYADTDKGT